MAGWALDLGTTNSGIACWDEALGKPRLIELPDIARSRGSEDPLEAPRLVPSAVHFLERPGWLARRGSWPPLARRFFIGRRAVIGRPALERNQGVVHPSFVPTFKPGLSDEPLRPLGRVGLGPSWLGRRSRGRRDHRRRTRGRRLLQSLLLWRRLLWRLLPGLLCGWGLSVRLLRRSQARRARRMGLRPVKGGPNQDRRSRSPWLCLEQQIIHYLE